MLAAIALALAIGVTTPTTAQRGGGPGSGPPPAMLETDGAVGLEPKTLATARRHMIALASHLASVTPTTSFPVPRRG